MSETERLAYEEAVLKEELRKRERVKNEEKDKAQFDQWMKTMSKGCCG